MDVRTESARLAIRLNAIECSLCVTLRRRPPGPALGLAIVRDERHEG
jgi:hypothetical protein